MSGYELDFMCLPFKGVPGFLADSLLYLEKGFLQQMLCGILFLVLVLLAGEPNVGLRPHASGGGFLQLRYLSLFSVATFGCRASPFGVFILPTSFDMVSSVNPWL